MFRYLRLARLFAQASLQEETAYRANFFISLTYSLLNLSGGILAVVILFSQVEAVNGWNLASTLAILGIHLTLGALRNLVFGPSLESMSGMEGDVWSGRLDFTLLRPANTQFLASFRKWQLFALFDLALGSGVITIAAIHLGQMLTLYHLLAFLLALLSGVAILYATLLVFSALVFWSPGVLFTWMFDGVFQMARYPLGLYPGWLQFILTWIIPVGIITTIPAEALTGMASPIELIKISGLAISLCVLASWLFRYGVSQYKSASS